MKLFHPDAESVARKYIGTKTPLEVLGWGTDGAVFHIPAATTAIKVYPQKRPELFRAELAVYRRLRKHKVTQIQGFAIPQASKYDAELLVIEMSIVKPRCLLDFAKATVDQKHDFPRDKLEWYWQSLEEKFGDHFPTVLAVNSELINKYGIYYWDFKPDNLQFDSSPTRTESE